MVKRVLLILAFVISWQGVTLSANTVAALYDPLRDPFQDFAQAQLEAEKNNKLIMIQVGGNWCSWCIKLDRFISKSADITALLNDNFVVMKVNVNEENYNEDFLQQLPEFEGYPFLVITDQNGEVLKSITSGYLEEGSGYSEIKFREYFKSITAS